MVRKQPNKYTISYRNTEGLDRVVYVNAYSIPAAIKSVKSKYKVKHINKVTKS